MSGKLDIEAAIRHAVTVRTAEIIGEEAALAGARVRERLAGEADKLALGVLAHYDVTQDVQRIVISVKKGAA